MRMQGKTLILGLAILLLLASGVLAQPKMLRLDGTLWVGMPLGEKMAYIVGVGNMAAYETASGGSGRAACISRSFVDELKSKTTDQIVAEVDKFYKEKQDNLKMPVIDVVLRQCTKLCPPEAPATVKK